MANRILISLGEDVTEPVWFNNVEPFIQIVLQKLNYDNEEISVLFCSDEFIKELNNVMKNYNIIIYYYPKQKINNVWSYGKIYLPINP